MSHKNQESLHEFNNLIEQLSQPDSQPISMRMTPTAKQALRQQLLNQYDERTLSRQGAWHLWRFAGGVAAVLLLAIAVVGFGLAISQARTTGSPAVNPTASEVETATSTSLSAGVPTLTPDTSTRPTPPIPNLPPEFPIDLGDNIRLIGFSFLPGSNQPDQSLLIALSWETTGQPSANYSAFVQLLDENGRLAAQVDEPLGETSSFTDGTKFNALLTLPLSDNLTPGVYTIATGLYDSRTGQQLPQNNDGQSIHLALWEILARNLLTKLPAELGDHFRLIGFSHSPPPYQPGQPLQVTLSWETTGRPTADYTAFVHLLDQNGNLVAQADQVLGETSTFVNGTRPRTSLTMWLPDDLSPGTFLLTTGLYDNSTGQRLPDNDNGSDLYLMQIVVTPEPVWDNLTDRVWIISAAQSERATVSAPITFEVTLGVELTSADEAILKLFYTNPAWQTQTEGRLPVDGLGEDQIVYPNTETVTISAVLDPIEMVANVKTNTPILMAQLGTLNPDKLWQSSFDTSILSTFMDVQFDLQSLDEIEYQFDDHDPFEP